MQINSSANSLVWQRLEDKNNFRSKNDNNMIDNFVNRKVGEWPSRKLCIYQWNSRHPESLQSLKHYEIAQTETKFSPVGTIKDTLQCQWNIKLLLVANAITKCKQIIFSIYQIKTI